jgi:hypothetical protein
MVPNKRESTLRCFCFHFSSRIFHLVSRFLFNLRLWLREFREREREISRGIKYRLVFFSAMFVRERERERGKAKLYDYYLLTIRFYFHDVL